MRRKIALFSTLGVFVILGAVIIPRPGYHYQPHSLPADFDSFYAMKLKQSKEKGARPGCEEKLNRFGPKTEYAILYLHGYGASRAEGEESIDRFANKLHANTYYVRLPGHGTNMEDQASVSYTDYLDESEEALQMMPALGEKIIIVGTSMGALLATHLAAEHPDKLYALIIASPFYEFVRKEANIASVPGGGKLAEVFGGGKIRDVTKRPDDVKDKRSPGFENYWYEKQYFSSIQSLARLKKAVSGEHTFGRVTAPVLMIYYYKNENEQDTAASVPAMLEGFHQFGKFTRPSPYNRSVAVADGDHIMFSKWIPTDKDLIDRELNRFIDDLKK